jgi:hypothetical protein
MHYWYAKSDANLTLTPVRLIRGIRARPFGLMHRRMMRGISRPPVPPFAACLIPPIRDRLMQNHLDEDSQ